MERGGARSTLFVFLPEGFQAPDLAEPGMQAPLPCTAAVVGGGPAGLMAAEALIQRGVAVHLFDRMPTVGRKFLMAGRGGLNLTHSEPLEGLLARYGSRRPRLEPLLRAFGPDDLRAWAEGLGVETFVGTSGRVFPRDMKAAPLLRNWLRRLRESGAVVHVRHRWVGWTPSGDLRFETPEGPRAVRAGVVVLALGGATWSRLGSDGAWVPVLAERGIPIETLRPANCGFEVAWTPHFRERYAGHPVKSVAAAFPRPRAAERQGEFVITEAGVEGSLVYAFAAALRDEIDRTGTAVLHLDLVPGRGRARLEQDLATPRGSRSLAEHLRRRAGVEGVKAGLLREAFGTDLPEDPVGLAAALKAVPLRLLATRPLDEAISTAGGVAFEGLDPHLMLRALPGVFCAGEMLDWEAPTGGYLLTACFATGRAAGRAAADLLEGDASP